MPLSTPTGLTVSRLRAVGQDTYVTGNTIFPGPDEISIYGFVEWNNTESTDHVVEILSFQSFVNQKIVLPKGSTKADVLLAKFNVAEASMTQSVTVSAQLVGSAGNSSVASTTFTIDIATVGTFGTNLSVSFGTAIVLPTWSNVLWKPTLRISEENTGQQIALIGLSSLSSNKVALPPSIVAGKTYKATIEGRPDFERKTNYTAQGTIAPYYQILPSTLGQQSLVFSLSESDNTFTAVSEALKYLGGQFIKVPLRASHAATWAITSGPTGFSIIQESGQYFLAGTAPSSLSTLSFSLTATRVSDSATATATITIGIVAAIDRAQIIVNPGWLNNGLSYSVGDSVSVALACNPQTGVVWSATGLPPGLSIDSSSGLISGRVTSEGRFLANIVASPIQGSVPQLPGPDNPIGIIRETGLSPSLPAVISFTVRAASSGGGSGGGSAPTPSTPAVRIPWILDKWSLTDLQVLARTREVQSTLFLTSAGKTSLSLKVGDNVNFAVFFIGADDRPFQLAPDRLRLTIRPADNLEAALVFESETSPGAVTTEPDPYYLIAASTAGRQRQIVQEWVEDSGKNEPLACIADVDWTKNSQHFSSASFPVLIELDVSRP
jgi:hypothetical protein